MPSTLKDLQRDVRERVRRHDLPLIAAGLTFYAAVGVVPLLLVAVRLATIVLGANRMQADLHHLDLLLPDSGRGAVALLAERGPRLPLTWALAAVLPIGLYGEGLVRAFARLSPERVRRRVLRGRLTAACALVVVPLALLFAVLALEALRGRVGLLLGVYLTFLVAWAVASAGLAVGYRALTPASPRAFALAWSAAAAGSVVAGFGLGFVLLLSLGLDLGAAYGGQADLAVAALAGVWAYGLHLVVLAGYALALSVDARR